MQGLPDVDIFTLLIEKLKDQSFKDIELVIVDKLYDERKETFRRLRLPFPFKYIPPKPNPWQKIAKNAITISSDRNSGLLLARGEMIICLDDCAVPMHSDFLSMYWEHWKRHVLLRPICHEYDYTKRPPTIREDPLIPWRAGQPHRDYHRVSGNCGRCYLFPASVYEYMNGFDERCDGSWGREDNIFYYGIDMAGIERYIIGNGQHHIGTIWHRHDLYKDEVTPRFVCNEAYAQWKYRRMRDHRELQVNQKILDSEDIGQIELMCKECPCSCGKKVPPGLEFYEKFQPVFDLSELRKTMIDKFGDETGAINPWVINQWSNTQ